MLAALSGTKYGTIWYGIGTTQSTLSCTKYGTIWHQVCSPLLVVLRMQSTLSGTKYGTIWHQVCSPLLMAPYGTRYTCCSSRHRRWPSFYRNLATKAINAGAVSKTVAEVRLAAVRVTALCCTAAESCQHAASSAANVAAALQLTGAALHV